MLLLLLLCFQRFFFCFLSNPNSLVIASHSASDSKPEKIFHFSNFCYCYFNSALWLWVPWMADVSAIPGTDITNIWIWKWFNVKLLVHLAGYCTDDVSAGVGGGTSLMTNLCTELILAGACVLYGLCFISSYFCPRITDQETVWFFIFLEQIQFYRVVLSC